jgi:hypothetical protein
MYAKVLIEFSLTLLFFIRHWEYRSIVCLITGWCHMVSNLVVHSCSYHDHRPGHTQDSCRLHKPTWGVKGDYFPKWGNLIQINVAELMVYQDSIRNLLSLELRKNFNILYF